jgi:hypothetical protein
MPVHIFRVRNLKICFCIQNVYFYPQSNFRHEIPPPPPERIGVDRISSPFLFLSCVHEKEIIKLEDCEKLP